MSSIEAFRYDGKRALVVGGATGMGAAAARTAGALGAEVVVMDYAPVEYPVAKAIKVDLRDRGAVDAALDEVGGPVHALFSAAGVADGTPGIMKINFIAHRHIIERLVGGGIMPSGSAICMISSVAGLGWENNMPTLLEFLATPDYESADAWIQAHEGTDGYGFSKQAMNCYCARQAYPFMAKGIRINAICPGPTDTPLARANADVWLAFAQDYRDATGTKHLTPDQMGDVMVFLNSDAASGISGVNLLVDSGHVMSSMTGSWEPGAAMINAMMGRT
ncbi:MAG TPA: SDR family oxidoreductase [Acidimicrobiales bacterium]|nr:SDR family oxidoreductase [Acidimicrobiales bacterium]